MMMVFILAGGFFFFISLCLILFWFFCRENGLKPGSPSATLIFFDELFYGGGGRKINFAAASMFVALIFIGGAVMVKNNLGFTSISIMGYGFGILGIVSLFIHCRFFSMRQVKRNGSAEALKELFYFGGNVVNDVFLWLSRFFYILWFYFCYLK